MVSTTILMSLVTSVKDYVEIAHKLIESAGPFAPQSGNFANSLLDSNLSGSGGSENNFFVIRDYTEFGAILTYVVLSIKEFLTNFFTFKWLSSIWSLPLIVPDVTSAMISEISVLDNYFTNAFSFLEKGVSTTLQTNVGNLSLATDNLVALEKINQNQFLFGFEKFIIGFLNSFFLFLPSSTAHLITLRRFVMQGIEAGFVAGLGTIAGNFLWLSSIILGLRFIVIPWLSLDIFRYILGFMLLVKYLWDSSKELNKTNSGRTATLDNNAKTQIFLLNFLLALTEQTSIYPFISNMSFGAEGSILEGFHWLGTNSENIFPFLGIHLCYLLGILLGSFSLLQFAVWFWENPAFSIYMWIISANNAGRGGSRVTTSTYYKVMNFVFLYLTMLCAISSIPYFGLDYTITKPLGLIPQDRMIDQKLATASGKSEPILQEFSFLGVKPTDKNSRTKDGVHARRERWKERLIKYQAFDGSVYGQGSYDILTVEDLNYGFDRFWLRRKMRNHQIRFRLFPGPWMRSIKKQLNKPGSQGPRTEFFRILFEQYYHPSFGRKTTTSKSNNVKMAASAKGTILTQGANSASLYQAPGQGTSPTQTSLFVSPYNLNNTNGSASLYTATLNGQAQTEANPNLAKVALQKGLVAQHSALRKFSSNVALRMNKASIQKANFDNFNNKSVRFSTPELFVATSGAQISNSKQIYSKSLKNLFTKIKQDYSLNNYTTFRNLSKSVLTGAKSQQNTFKKTFFRKKLSKKERSLLIYKTNLNNYATETNIAGQLRGTNNIQGFINPNTAMVNGVMGGLATKTPLVQPLNYYLQKNDLFKLKLQYYSTAITRKFSPGNNQPYFKTLLKRAFYYHKPTLRLKRTLFTAAMRRGFRKKSAQPRKLLYKETGSLSTSNSNTGAMIATAGATALTTNAFEQNMLSAPYADQERRGLVQTTDTGQYSVLGKLTSRYRYQIYKDVLQHWYYSPFNRLLLKFDVDSFMARQPKDHFLTKKEERLLHLRRVLLYEHYNTLRWYTYMQHYLTMKSRIGGTKSFASTAYNQQFQGTFKKIRHLFYITPSQADSLASGDMNPSLQKENSLDALTSKVKNLKDDSQIQILKFDQPLYNSENLTKSLISQNAKEQQGSKKITPSQNQAPSSGVYKHWNLGQQSPTQTNLSADAPREKLTSNDFVDTSLMLGGALMGSNSIGSLNSVDAASTKTTSNFDSKVVMLDLLQQSKKFLNNQTFLKNYISHRIEKRTEQLRTSTPQNNKELKSVMLLGSYAPRDSFKNWYNPIYSQLSSTSNVTSLGEKGNTSNLNITTGARKALNDGVFVLNNKNPAQQSKAFFTKENLALKFTDKKASALLSQRSELNKKTEEQLKATLTSILDLTKTTSKWSAPSSSRGVQNKLTSQVNKVSSTTIKSLRNVLSTTIKPILILQNKILAKRSEKTLEWWRQKQRVMSKLKSSRKKSRFKNIKTSVSQRANANNRPGAMSATTATLQTYLLPQNILNNSAYSDANLMNLRKKTDNSNLGAKEEKMSQNSYIPYKRSLVEQYFVRKFKKQAKGRRYRNVAMTGSRGFAYVRKPKNINSFTTAESYLNDLTPIVGNLNTIYATSGSEKFDLLLSKEEKTLFLTDFKKKLASNIVKVSNETPDKSELPNARQASLTENSGYQKAANKLKNLLIQGYVKKSPSKKRSKRTWKKRKRQKFTKNHYKYRKRQIHGLGKLVVLAKKTKKLKAKLRFQNWWWNSYLPSKANLASQAPRRLTDVNTKIKVNNVSFKPLSTEKALELMDSTSASKSTGINTPANVQKMAFEETKQTSSATAENSSDFARFKSQDASVPGPNGYASRMYNSTATIPFYAGWDESLRKFVVTNRLLSRTKAGSEVDLNTIFNLGNLSMPVPGPRTGSLGTKGLTNVEKEEKTTEFNVEFTNAPIKGLNEGSFLFLQTEMPFNSYIIDQFIPNNQSFYAPLGWSNFQFKHSLLKTWLNNKGETNAIDNSEETTKQARSTTISSPGTEKVVYITKTPDSIGTKKGNALGKNNLQYLLARRIKKRYKLLKQTPIQLMYAPTGQLLAQTLPSHYISVFDKQYRFPRNIYIKRSLPNSKNLAAVQLAKGGSPTSTNIKDLAVLEYANSQVRANSRMEQKGNVGKQLSNGQIPDFTLRKRIKPKRKYHKKRLYKKDFLIFPRRAKFGTVTNEMSENDNFRLRPSVVPTQTVNAKKSKANAQARNAGKTNPVRLRQLRRREFSQVFKPLQRFQPRYGGFTWPGDYLRLEVIPMPKLESFGEYALKDAKDTQYLTVQGATNNGLSSSGTQTRTAKSKAKINVQPVGLLPRKYFVQKHNLKVFKKKLSLKYV